MFKELEIEMEILKGEKEYLNESLEETIQKRKDEIYNIEKITSIEETYYMQANILDGLERDYLELKTSLQVIEDQNSDLMAIKDVEDRSYEQKNQQISNSKSMYKELEREFKQLKVETMKAQMKKQEYME